jgi:hypothetical protein
VVTIVEEEADLMPSASGESKESMFLKVFREGMWFFSADLESLEASFPVVSNERLVLEKATKCAVVDLVWCPRCAEHHAQPPRRHHVGAHRQHAELGGVGAVEQFFDGAASGIAWPELAAAMGRCLAEARLDVLLNSFTGPCQPGSSMMAKRW